MLLARSLRRALSYAVLLMAVAALPALAQTPVVTGASVSQPVVTIVGTSLGQVTGAKLGGIELLALSATSDGTMLTAQLSQFYTPASYVLDLVYAAPAAAAAVCPSPQPGFGWVCVGGGWLPPGHPLIPAPSSVTGTAQFIVAIGGPAPPDPRDRQATRARSGLREPWARRVRPDLPGRPVPSDRSACRVRPGCPAPSAPAAAVLSSWYGRVSGSPVLAVVIAGTNVPFAGSIVTVGSDVTADVTNSVFTLGAAGTYRVRYQTGLTLGTLFGARITINGIEAAAIRPSVASPTFADEYVFSAAANDVVRIQLFDLLGAATLLHGFVSIQRLPVTLSRVAGTARYTLSVAARTIGPPMIGQTVTHYRILDKIGEGGMGVVYRAEDTRLGRQVAVKFLSSALSKDQLALERFQREARAASSLNHPHICSLYDVGQHGDQPFIVMELLDGQTLRERIGEKPLPLDVLLDLGVQITEGLDVAHAANIVHRDIKSANIFVTARGQAKIVDFGLAKLFSAQQLDSSSDTATMTPGGRRTTVGETLGTPSYMSPEQARGEELDGRSDLFSFGAVLYEMATGQEAFTGRTAALVSDAILRQAPTPPSAVNPRVSQELEHIILKALEKDRDLRYQTAAEIRADLKRARRSSDAMAATTVLPARPAVAPGRRPPRWLWAASGVVAAGLAIWAGYAALRPARTAVDSVAVLPFVAADAGSETEYLADGVTETLINGLAQIPGLRVAARSLVFRYKGANVDAQQAGRDLNVTALVTGRISTRGDRLVIQADLVNVADGSQVWGGQYNRPIADLLVVQEEIASEILDRLGPQLSGADRQRAVRRYTDNVRAYQQYLQGRYHWHKGTIEGYQNAIGYFQSAIREDPRYALAYAGLADSQLLLGAYWVESIPEAKAAAERALALDPGLAEAHVALGHIKQLLDWDWTAAGAEFRQGITLDPGSALAHNQYAQYLTILNRMPEALVEARRALDLEPRSPIVNADLGLHLLYANKIPDAIAQFQKTLDIDANSVSAEQGLGIAYSLAGQHDAALAALGRALKLSENSPVVLGHIGAAQARKGDRASAERTLADLDAQSARAYVPATSFAVVHAALGNRDQAIEWLDRAYDEHDFSLPRVRVAPWFQSIVADERMRTLFDRLGLPR